jgi:phage shock protein C
MDTRKLYRSSSNRVFTGVCGGIGEYFNIDPVIVRLLWVFASFFSLGAGLLAYLIAAVIIPERDGNVKGNGGKGCLYVILIVLLAGVLFSILSAILGVLGGIVGIGASQMAKFWHPGYYSSFIEFNPVTAILATGGILSVIAVIIIIIILIKKIGKNDN